MQTKLLKHFPFSQLHLNMLSGTLIHIIEIAILAISFPIYLHFLGSETYGLWLTLGIIISIGNFGDLGIGNAITKLVAEEHGRHGYASIERYIMTGLTLVSITGCVIVCAIVLLRTPIITIIRLEGDVAQTAILLLPVIGILSAYVVFVRVINATLAGLGRMDLASYTQVTGRIIGTILSILLLYTKFGIISLIAGAMVTQVTINIMSLWIIHRWFPIEIFKFNNISFHSARSLLHFGSGICAASFVGMFVDPFNKAILARYAGTGAIPLYDLAFRLSRNVKALAEVALRAIMPEISRLWGETKSKPYHTIANILRKSTLLTIVFGGVSFLFLGAVLDPLLKFWLQAQFSIEYPWTIRLFFVGTFMNLIAVPSYYVLMGIGQVRKVFFIRFITATCNIIVILSIIWLHNTVSVYHVGLSLLIGWLISSIYALVSVSTELRKKNKCNTQIRAI